ncbi:MAG TPA: YceI family protein [Pyrinomonadaceae bacterium]|nr:YceI family protein [Pyrinomonadaceae bacterium]
MQPEAAKETDSTSKSIWHFEPSHTTVEFTIRNFFSTVRGSFSVGVGAILLDENDIASSAVKATINAASISTGIKRRDAHLRSSDFLQADQHPNIQFQSSKVGPGKDRDMLAVTGLLTIRGMNKEIVLEVSEVDRSRSPDGEEVIYYCVTTEIDRFAFGIKYGRGVIGRMVKVTINVQASREV